MDAQLRDLQVTYKGKTHRLSIRLRSVSDPNGLIVFLHGWGGSKESFAGAFSSEALKEFEICTIDLLGFGKSEKPEDFSYDLLDQANVVALAINSLNAKKVCLVGHSMGGGIGLLAAPLVKNLAIFVSVEGNLVFTDARAIYKQPFWLFKASTLPSIILLLRLHPRRGIRAWAQWFDEASPLGLYQSIQSLVKWSGGCKLLPLFTALPHKAYIYSANGKRKKDVVPKLDKSITYEIPASNHALMSDNPGDFYATVARITQHASSPGSGYPI